jgi:radial spoke head protein 3
MVIPAGTYPDNLFGNTGKSKKSPGKSKRNTQNNMGPSEEFFQRDIRTPEPVSGRQNIDIQTDQFVEELTDKAPHYEIGNQTEFIIEREETPFNIPMKRGVDKKTLVQDNELFKFDKEVEPILSVLCGKTLEFARMEVLEEEELRVMKGQQQHFTELNKTEVSDAQRMEQMEQRKLQEFERKKALERERKKNKIAAHRKVCARTLAKSYMSNI